MQTPSTTTLVQRCLHGDANAWTQLVERYARLVHAVSLRHGLTPAEAEDVAQEVFVALAQHLHAIDDPERLPGWLATTARRLSWRASQRRRYEIPLEGEHADDEENQPAQQLISPLPTPEEVLAAWSRQESLRSAMRRLQTRCRDLLTLIFLDRDEPSYDTIGERLGIPKGSIGPTRNRCLQQLRAILEGLGVNSAE